MDALDRVYLGNSLGAWLAALVTTVVGTLLLRTAKALLLRWLSPHALRTSSLFDDQLVAIIGATRAFFVYLFPLLMGLGLLDLGRVPDLVVGHLRTAVLILQIGAWLSAALRRWTAHVVAKRATKDQAGVTSLSVLRVALVVVLWVMVMLILLDNLGVDVMTLIAGLGVGGVAIALAVQGILSDLVASVVIVLDKPFVIGDAITVGELSGTVESIGMKTTRLRSSGGEEIVFSHSDLIGSRIRNFRTLRERRVQFSLGVPYTIAPDALAAIPALVRDIVGRASAGGEADAVAVRFERSHVASFGESSIVIETAYVVLDPDYARYMDLHQRILTGVHRAFAERGIAFAVPTRTVHLVDHARGAAEPDDGASATPSARRPAGAGAATNRGA